ncbi:HD-GYP domain-containing protein [Patescibacteria group bacterium]
MTIQYEKSTKLHDTLMQSKSITKHLDEIKKHHDESYEHSVRVGLLSIDLANENKLSEEYVKLAGEAGLLHDLGKSGISIDILSKKTILTEHERMNINTHPRIGFIKLDDERYEEIRKVLIAHHEYKKGQYPRSGKDRRSEVRPGSVDRRIPNKMIDVIAQIVGIADMFDALTSRRSYKEKFDENKVKKILEEQFIGDDKYIEQVMRRI